jgi:hypothetical protein
VPQEYTTIEEIEARCLGILKKKASREGLVYSKLTDACGKEWRRSLAKLKRLRSGEARATDVKQVVYELWSRGLILIEPPSGLQRAPRIWDREAGVERFPAVLGEFSPPVSGAGPNVGDFDRLKQVYDGFASQHAGGYVPIFKVRRALGWPREKFDRMLRELNERRNPVIELHGGDPQRYTDDERADSLIRDLTLLLRMRWRE